MHQFLLAGYLKARPVVIFPRQDHQGEMVHLSHLTMNITSTIIGSSIPNRNIRIIWATHRLIDSALNAPNFGGCGWLTFCNLFSRIHLLPSVSEFASRNLLLRDSAKLIDLPLRNPIPNLIPFLHHRQVLYINLHLQPIRHFHPSLVYQLFRVSNPPCFRDDLTIRITFRKNYTANFICH
jgi:hypothetical protein